MNRYGFSFFFAFAVVAAVVLATDRFRAPQNRLTEMLSARTPAPVAEALADLERQATEFEREAAAATRSEPAVARADAAVLALFSRLEELDREVAGAEPAVADDLRTRLDAIERDFELRELMVTEGESVVDESLGDSSKHLEQLNADAAELRARVEKGEDEAQRTAFLRRLDAVDGRLEAARERAKAARRLQGAGDPVKQARDRFHELVTKVGQRIAALRAR